MSKRSFYDLRNAKKMLRYGSENGLGAFRRKSLKKTDVKEPKPKQKEGKNYGKQ